MGRLGNSQPSVIQTELTGLDEVFYIEALGETEQWYYENTNTYAPDRQVTPLLLVPNIQVTDKDTRTTYVPAINGTAWSYTHWNGTAWETVPIEDADPTEALPFVQDGNNLRVMRNVSDAAHGITIICQCDYIDPRDAGITHTVEESVLLSVNKDGSAIFPLIKINNESGRPFNPLICDFENDGNLFSFNAWSDWSQVPKASESVTEYKAEVTGKEEVLADTLSCAPTMDILYGEGSGATLLENQKFTKRNTGGGELSSIPNNLVFVQNVKGETVKYNQLVQNGDFSNGSTPWLSNGLNNKVVVSNGVGSFTPTGQYNSISQTIVLQSGHKYYVSTTVKNDTIDTYVGVGFGSGNTFSTEGVFRRFYDIGTWETHSWIGTYDKKSNGNNIITMQMSQSASYQPISIDNVQVIDLTAMFGTDAQIASALGISTSDITTSTGVAAFESWLSTNLGDKDYYPYNTGSLVPVKSTGIRGLTANPWLDETVVWNQLIYNGDFSKSPSGFSVSGGDATIGVNDGVLIFTPNGQYNSTWKSINLTSGHRYYVSASIKNDTTDTYVGVGLGFGGSFTSEGVFRRFEDIGTWKTQSWIGIYDKKGNDNKIIIMQMAQSASYQPISIDNVQVIDLTMMFGSDDKIAAALGITVADINTSTGVTAFESWLSRNIGNQSYYDYNAGTTISVNPTGVLSVGKLPITSLKGKLNGTGSLTTVFPDGLKKAGSVYDEIKYDNGVLKAIKRVGSVDLGSLTYTKQGTDVSGKAQFVCGSLLSPNALVVSASVIGNIICYKYDCITSNNMYSSTTRGVAMYEGRPRVSLSEFDSLDADQAKTAMNGVYLYYELATPQEYILDNINNYEYEWWGAEDGVESLAETFPWYVSGQHTDELVVDAMYGNPIQVVLRIRKYSWDAQLLPPRDTASVVWQNSNIDAIVSCDNGSAVRVSNDSKYVFRTIVNTKKRVLDDETRQEHLRFNWKTRKSGATQVTDRGWGDTLILKASDLMNKTIQGSNLQNTNVHNEVYMLEHYKKLVHGEDEIVWGGSDVVVDGETILKNQGLIYGRTI